MIKRVFMAVTMAALMAMFFGSMALAESEPSTIRGTNAGDALYGTGIADTIYGYGGADLVYGYAGRDTIYGGNESGWGDKILGGGANDKILGQDGEDALYGQGGNDIINGGKANDVVEGGGGSDILNGGPGFDQVNAQDGLKDTIVVCGNENDKIYYDKELDVLRYCEAFAGSAMTAMSTSDESTAIRANLSTQNPPKSVFENTGKVLVGHGGDEKCISEKDLKVHLDHGDEIIDPTGCSSPK